MYMQELLSCLLVLSKQNIECTTVAEYSFNSLLGISWGVVEFIEG